MEKERITTVIAIVRSDNFCIRILKYIYYASREELMEKMRQAQLGTLKKSGRDQEWIDKWKSDGDKLFVGTENSMKEVLTKFPDCIDVIEEPLSVGTGEGTTYTSVGDGTNSAPQRDI